MKRASCMLLIAISLVAIDTARAHAQVGPLIDWIHKMSGPKFLQWGATYSVGYEPGLELDSREVTALIAELNKLVPPGERAAPGALEMQTAQIRAQTISEGIANVRRNFDQLAGPTRYRAVLVDRISAEMRRLTKDAATLTDSAAADPLTRSRTLERLNRLDAALDDLRSVNALDRGNGMRARLAIMGGTSALSAHQKNPDSAAINIITISPTAEYLITRHFAFETGIGIHYFFGDIEPIWNVSLPVLAVIRPLASTRLRFLRSLRANFGFNMFAPFQSDAFNPVSSISETGVEFVWTGFVSIDFPIRDWR